ncbi:peptidoglycan DD-metalloendopeptidase family protein [Candidatus Nomurabacteria bacterium]|nr:peptidoglycan DD-metalloendopeptidase family protein [Candidatus Nomurabacteria bacterium]
MKKYVYKSWLLILRSLIYAKRALVWLFFKCVSFFYKTADGYNNTVGYKLHQWVLRFKRNYNRRRISQNALIDFLGRRGVLQILFFLIAIGVSFPHSKLYSFQRADVVGRDTKLYSLLGPGEQDFSIEDDLRTDFALLIPKDSRSWKEGAVTEGFSGTDLGAPATDQEYFGVSEDGSAITKPTIMPGAQQPNSPSPEAITPEIPTPASGKRKDNIIYVVKPGDVLGKISEQYNVSLSTILAANNLTARSYIRPGDKLTIPPVDGVVHTVGSGDTINTIARRYDADAAEILDYNDITDGGRSLQIGQKLVIPGGTAPVIVQAPSKPAPSNVAQKVSSIAAPRPSVNTPAGQGYIWPTDAKTITQYFGWRHTGLDIAGPSGISNYAAKAGVVIKSQDGWNGGYGNYVIIDHGNGVHTLYAHNSQRLVEVGQEVAQGQVVGILGSTGRSTGPHLHFEVRVNGTRVNPLQYIR